LRVIILPDKEATRLCKLLPDPDIFKRPSVLGVPHPNGKDIVILKFRKTEKEKTLALQPSDIGFFEKPFEYGLDLTIFDHKVICLTYGSMPYSIRVELLKLFDPQFK
jgi:hypothetical protein